MAIVTDDFNRSNTSTMTGYTELIGDWEVVSNKLQCNTDGGGTGYYLRHDTDTGSNDMYSQAVTSSAQANSSSNTGVLCRGQTGATNTSYQFTTNHGADTWGMWRVTAGSETQLGSGSTAIASGDTIRLETAGSILRGKINGTLVALVRDTTTAAGTRGGLNGYNAVGTDVVELDNFETGSIADNPPAAPYINGWSAQSSGTGTTQAPGVPANSIAAGVCVLAWITSKDAAQTVTAPAGEGWVLVENPSQTGLEGYLFAKIWGLGGQTDSSTPTFSIGSGTAGWLTTLQLVRNPAHATNPWTSVASAIIASGSSSNAAASTVSAPSVSASGTHLTVIRFFGSADDNALGGATTGGGVLSFNGAAYDQTTNGGIAQASMVLEDATVGSSTGTATVTETVAGNDISNGVTVVFAIPSSGTTVTAISETDALVGVARSSSKTVGLLSESDALLAVARSSSQAVGGVAEIDALLSAAATHGRTVASLGESDILSAAQRSVATALGVLGESDALVATSATHSRTVAALSELDSLLALVPASYVGVLAETDVLAPAGHLTSRAAGLLAETDGLTALERTTDQLVLALTEIDVLGPGARSAGQLVGLLSEIDSLLAPVIEVSDAQLSADGLKSRLAAAGLTGQERQIGSLGQRLVAGELESEP